MLFSAKSRSYSVPSEDGCEIIVDLLIVIWGIRMKNYRIQSNVTLATWILNKSWRYFAKQYAPHPLSLALFGLLAHARSAPFFLPQSFCNLLPTMCVRVFFSIMFNIFISGIIIIGISIPCKYKRHLLIENSHQYQLHLYDDFYNSPLALHRFNFQWIAINNLFGLLHHFKQARMNEWTSYSPNAASCFHYWSLLLLLATIEFARFAQ